MDYLEDTILNFREINNHLFSLYVIGKLDLASLIRHLKLLSRHEVHKRLLSTVIFMKQYLSPVTYQIVAPSHEEGVRTST